MASSTSSNVTSAEATRPDGFYFLEEPTDVAVLVDPEFRNCMLALRILLYVSPYYPVLGGDRGVVVVVNTVFFSQKEGESTLIGNFTVKTVQEDTLTLYTLFKDSSDTDSLLCLVQKCSQLVYANVLYIINSVLYNGKLKAQSLELSPSDQSLFLDMFSATVIYLAHVLYGLDNTHFYDFNCPMGEQEHLNELYDLYRNNVGTNQDDIVRKLYLLLFYKFQQIMNEKTGGVFISDYIE